VLILGTFYIFSSCSIWYFLKIYALLSASDGTFVAATGMGAAGAGNAASEFSEMSTTSFFLYTSTAAGAGE
jgi:hypothetical protein